MLRWGKGQAWAAGLAVVLSVCSTAAAGSERQAHDWSGRPADKPAYLWLWYPDESNKANTEAGPYCADLTPKPYSCTFGANVEDCKRQVESYLDAWYADFNIIITLDRPSADYYTVVVTSDGSWCPHDFTEGEVAGFAFSSGCNDITGFAGYALECGDNAHDCATTIAHEHAHMVGLEHTVSITDIMNPRIHPTAKGFDDQDNATVDDTCDFLTQNSYQRMLAALGPWPGGPKPSAFSSNPDAGSADVPPEASATDAADVAHASGSIGTGLGPSVDGGAIIALPGFDALTRPPLPTVDAARANGGSSHGGCSLAGRLEPASASGAAAVAFLLYLLAAGLIRTARRARPAAEPLPCAGPARSPSAARARGR